MLFDLNRNGELDDFEKAAALASLFTLFSQEEESTKTADAEEELELAGLDHDELSLMDEEERDAALEDAGLDPEDFDF